MRVSGNSNFLAALKIMGKCPVAYIHLCNVTAMPEVWLSSLFYLVIVFWSFRYCSKAVVGLLYILFFFGHVPVFDLHISVWVGFFLNL